MGHTYYLKYQSVDLESGKVLVKRIEAQAIQYGTDRFKPMEQRYFCGVEKGPPEKYVCFIKRFVADKKRYKLERNAARISSPYVAAPYIPPQMKKCWMVYCDDESCQPLKGEIFLYEYLPNDLTAFRKRYTGGKEMPDAYRRDILLKLIQGMGHIHQARIIHHDIKPGNILINCRGLCEKAPWNRQELDVKLTDFDSMYDEDCGMPPLNAGTVPFQPQCKVPSSVWLDIYSLCMVALWLYDSREDYLSDISRELPKTVEEIEHILELYRVAVPKHIRQILVPHLLRAASQMRGRLDESQWETGAKELLNLYQELDSAFMGGWQPIELLGPAQAPVAWSAVVQVDQELWPVYGQGREYRMLPIMSWLSGRYRGITNSEEGGYLELSEPPTIFVAGEQVGGVWSLKAGIYGFVNQQRWCLAQQERLLDGEDVVLYHGTPICVSGDRETLFQNVAIHAVHFYSEKERPAVLPPFKGAVRNKMADINLVFVMVVSKPADSSGGLDCRLIRQVTDEMSKLEECNTCYYGFIMRQGDENVYSFCKGQRNPSGEDMSELYSGAANTVWNPDSPLWHGARGTKYGYAFDPGLPTIVIGYLDHPLDWDTDIVQRFKERMSPCFRYAVQYFQLFTTNQPDLTAGLRKLTSCLAVAVEPDGACILTPLSESVEFPDPKDRRLTAVRYWYQRRAAQLNSKGEN